MSGLSGVYARDTRYGIFGSEEELNLLQGSGCGLLAPGIYEGTYLYRPTQKFFDGTKNRNVYLYFYYKTQSGNQNNYRSLIFGESICAGPGSSAFMRSSFNIDILDCDWAEMDSDTNITNVTWFTGNGQREIQHVSICDETEGCYTSSPTMAPTVSPIPTTQMPSVSPTYVTMAPVPTTAAPSAPSVSPTAGPTPAPTIICRTIDLQFPRYNVSNNDTHLASLANATSYNTDCDINIQDEWFKPSALALQEYNIKYGREPRINGRQWWIAASSYKGTFWDLYYNLSLQAWAIDFQNKSNDGFHGFINEQPQNKQVPPVYSNWLYIESSAYDTPICFVEISMHCQYYRVATQTPSSDYPTHPPTNAPSASPRASPVHPTISPSFPTNAPTFTPTVAPSSAPSVPPTLAPSGTPTSDCNGLELSGTNSTLDSLYRKTGSIIAGRDTWLQARDGDGEILYSVQHATWIINSPQLLNQYWLSHRIPAGTSNHWSCTLEHPLLQQAQQS